MTITHASVRVRTLFLCVLFSLSLQAQDHSPVYRKVDSLILVAQSHLDSNYNEAKKAATQAVALSQKIPYSYSHIKAVGLQAEIYMHTSRCQEAKESLERLQQNENQIKDHRAKRELHLALGQYYYDFGDYDTAKTHYQKAFKLTTPKNPISEPLTYIKAAILYLKSGAQDQAIKHYEQALKLHQTAPTPTNEAWLAYCYGQIYYDQRLYEQSLELHQKALAQFQKLHHKRGMAFSELGKGNTHYLLYQDDLAAQSYNNALQHFLKLSDNSGAAICYSNLSRVSLEKQEHQRAVEYIEKALQLLGSGNYMTLEAGTYQQLGDSYAEMGQNQKAIAAIQKALAIARQSNNKTIIRDCYKSLSEMYNAMGQNKSAYDYLLAAYRIKDSIQRVEFSRRLAQMEAQYESAQKEEQIKYLQQKRKMDNLLLKEQEAKLQRHQLLLGMSMVVILVSAIALYFYLSKRRLVESVRQKELIREAEENERQRIAKDIHDDFGSGLSKIKVLSELATSKSATQPAELEPALQSISATSASLIENMKDLVWVMKPENSTLESLVARLREYVYDYLEDLPITIHFAMPQYLPNKEIAKTANRNIQMIFKEAIQNIVKHANASAIWIDIRIEDKLEIHIEDNGNGFILQEYSNSNGLINMRQRAKTLGGELHIDPVLEQGTYIKLTVPLDNENQ